MMWNEYTKELYEKQFIFCDELEHVYSNIARTPVQKN